MHDVNWWLMFLAFLLGLLLTLAMMVRRVTREVPVTHTVSASVKAAGTAAAAGAAAGGATAAAKLHGAAEKVERVHDRVHEHVQERVERVSAEAERVHERVHEHVQERVEKVSADAERVHEHVEKVVQKVQQVDVIEQVPYGGGSIRVTARKVGPAGYSIKGDKDTGRYFTSDSPEYADIEAEVWFANEASAEKAGFLRWDAKGDREAPVIAGAGAVITETHAAADIVITETHDVDATLVVVDDGPATTASAVKSGLVAATGDLPFGKGSARAGADGAGPAGWLIKGNADSGLYHGPDSPAYNQTIAEVWFVDEATAEAAGFKKWDINFK